MWNIINIQLVWSKSKCIERRSCLRAKQTAQEPKSAAGWAALWPIKSLHFASANIQLPNRTFNISFPASREKVLIFDVRSSLNCQNPNLPLLWTAELQLGGKSRSCSFRLRGRNLKGESALITILQVGSVWKNDDIEIVIKKHVGWKPTEAGLCRAHSSWPARGAPALPGPLIGHRALRCSHVDGD